jgi:hypothetical protein
MNMKKFLMTALLISGLSTLAPAQNMWLTGTFRLEGRSNATGESSLTLLPELGYNLDGRWAVGGQLGFMNQWQTNVQGNTRREGSFAVIPFVRYFLGDQNSVNFFLQGELPLIFHGGQNFDGSSMASTTSVGFNLRPGLFYSITDRWGLTMQMPSFIMLENHDGHTTYRLGINDGYTIQRYFLSTALGITYTF